MDAPPADASQLLYEARKLAPRVLVGLSGGKDSLVTLDLAVRSFGPDNVVAFSMYLVRGLRCFEGPIERAARIYGVQVEYVPHWMLGTMLKDAVLMPHRGDAHTWRDTKLVDIEQLVRQRTGIDWIAYGHRAAESIERRGMLNRCQGFNADARRVYPVWRWRSADVFSYMSARGIPLPPTFGKDRLSGVDLRPETLLYIREHFPDDYRKILEVFPFAEAQLRRWEMFPETRPVERETHGHAARGAHSLTYKSWRAMLDRCGNAKHEHYANYGGRGIMVCERWQDFEAFLADLGPRPSRAHSLEREDGDGNYEPGNVRWATRTEQARNRRTSRVVEMDGEKLTVAEWAERYGLARQVVVSRLERGWDLRRALTEAIDG